MQVAIHPAPSLTGQGFWKALASSRNVAEFQVAAKFNNNFERDRRSRRQLLDAGWRVAVVWECALVGGRILDTVKSLEQWLSGNEREFETVVARAVYTT